MNSCTRRIYLYGPSGAGKTTVGRLLAHSLDLPWIDLDEQIAAQAARSIPDIFSQDGEAAFRRLESTALAEAAAAPAAVVALGGGGLLKVENRRLAEASGTVVYLGADLDTLVGRLSQDPQARPLLLGEPRSQAEDPVLIRSRLTALLARRADHYASFPLRLETGGRSPEDTAWEIQVLLGCFRVGGMGRPYRVQVCPGGLHSLGEIFQENGLGGPVALVSDSNVAPRYAAAVLGSLEAVGYSAQLVTLAAGEQYKTIAAVQDLWTGFLQAGLDRTATVAALGGGVTGDLAGFAASTFLRGVRWVGVPTSLLAMVDSSLGGKTGADLPQGKNLIGAFHPPALVLADPAVLGTLPVEELRSGMAEVVKHGLIADPHLFELCAHGWESVMADLDEIVRRAMTVKIRIIEEDPYEAGRRAALNLGHTLGHAVELASDYRLRHGEAVAIGMAAAGRYAEKIELAENGLTRRIVSVLAGLGLPTAIPAGLDRSRMVAGMGVDKKRKGGSIRLALPVRVGEVVVGVPLENPENLLD